MREASAAAAILRCKFRGNLHFPDARLENSLAGKMTLATEIRRLRPRLLILPYWEARHPDHYRTSELAYEACFQLEKDRSKPITAEIILMLRALWQAFGLAEGRDVVLELNSLGQSEERRAHREALIEHFERHAELLDADARRRLHSNPLRILDTKNPAMEPVVASAPQLLQFLGAASLAHFDATRAMLDAAGLAYTVNSRLVRGMDYYNLTVFEWKSPHLGAQSTVCGGGRYDQLIETLGGKPAPGIGFGPMGEGHVRFALIENHHRTRQAIRSIKSLLRG